MVGERFCCFFLFFFSYAPGGFKCSPDSPPLCIPLSFLFQATQLHVEQHAGEKLRGTFTEELTLCCPEQKLENAMWSKQHRKEGQLGFIPPSPYSKYIRESAAGEVPGPSLWKLGTTCNAYVGCLLCAASPSSSGGDWEIPLLVVEPIGHGAFQTYSVCWFSTGKVGNEPAAATKHPVCLWSEHHIWGDRCLSAPGWWMC